MPYFQQQYLDFFTELTQNNNRDWFNTHKKEYETWVKKPFYAFVQLMIDRVQAIDNRVVITPKDAIFRINRDIRFSADKTPYKTHMSAIISPGGRKEKELPGIYIQFSPEDTKVYGGVYALNKDQLLKIRKAIVLAPEAFNTLIHSPKFVATFGTIQGEKNKRLPKEFVAAAENQPLIFNKAFYFFHAAPPETILQENLDDWIMQLVHIAKPLNDFFEEAMA